MRITLKENVLEKKRDGFTVFFIMQRVLNCGLQSFDPINLLIKYYKCLGLFEHWRHRSVKTVEATANYCIPW